MKKLLLIGSLFTIFCCSEPNKVKCKDVKVVKKTSAIHENNKEFTIEVEDSSNSYIAIKKNNNKTVYQPRELNDSQQDFSHLKYPKLVVVDDYCYASTSYFYDTINEKIQSVVSFPDCPSNDEVTGIYVTSLPKYINDSLRNYLKLEVNKIINKHKSKFEVHYIK